MDSRVQFHTRLKQASCMSCEDFPAKNKLSKYVAFRRVKGHLRPSTTQPTKLHFSHKGNTCSSGFQICWHIVLWNILSIFCQCNRQGLQKMKRQQHMLVAKIFKKDAHIALHTSTAEKTSWTVRPGKFFYGGGRAGRWGDRMIVILKGRSSKIWMLFPKNNRQSDTSQIHVKADSKCMFII